MPIELFKLTATSFEHTITSVQPNMLGIAEVAKNISTGPIYSMVVFVAEMDQNSQVTWIEFWPTNNLPPISLGIRGQFLALTGFSD